MGFNLLKYRIVNLRKLKTTYDLQQEFINIQQEWDIQVTEKKAEYIYKNKRLFQTILEGSSKASLLCQLAICLSYKNALKLIRSQEFSEALVGYKDAKEWLEKVDRKHYKIEISEECQNLWNQVEAYLQKKIDKQGALSEKNGLANEVARTPQPNPPTNNRRHALFLGTTEPITARLVTEKGSHTLENIKPKVPFDLPQPKNANTSQNRLQKSNIDSSYVPLKGGKLVDDSNNESMQALDKSIDLLLKETQREWTRNHSYLEEMHRRHLVWLPPSFRSKN